MYWKMKCKCVRNGKILIIQSEKDKKRVLETTIIFVSQPNGIYTLFVQQVLSNQL